MIDFGLWEKLSEENIAGMIYAGAKNLDDLKPSHDIIRLIGNPNEHRKILDFGCGVGRNIVGIVDFSIEWDIVGYDNEQMIDFSGLFVSDYNKKYVKQIFLLHDWNAIVNGFSTSQKFDTIFCCYVLQHIPEPQLRWYLEQFKEVGKELFVFGRRAIDPANTGSGYDGRNNFKSVWKIILDCGYKISEAQEEFALEGNGNDHHWVRFKHETSGRVDTDPQRAQLGRDDDKRDASWWKRQST